jgi:hypothetical protein
MKMANINFNELGRTQKPTIESWSFFHKVEPDAKLVDSLYAEHRASNHCQDGTRTLSKKDLSVLAIALQTDGKSFCVTNDAALLTSMAAYIKRHREASKTTPLAFAGLLLSMHENNKAENHQRWLVDASCRALEAVECGRIHRGISTLRWTERDATNVFKPYTVNFKKAVSYGV